MVNSIEKKFEVKISNVIILREIWKIDFKHKVNTFDLQ